MLIREIPFNLTLTTADGRRMGEGRSKGVHHSDILMYMRLHYAGEKIRKTDNDNWAMLGFAFETVVEDALRRYFGIAQDAVVSQSEACIDGIYITPDGYDLEGGCYQEYKATWKSLKKLLEFLEDVQAGNPAPRHFWYWLIQLKSNCHAAGTTKARLVAFFVMGDYSYRPPNGGPQFRCIEFEFTEQELEENWEMVKRVRDEMVEAGEVAA